MNAVPRLTQYSLLGILFIFVVFEILFVNYFLQFGFDLTDESFYIIWTNSAHLYSSSVSQFGFVYQKLVQYFGSDIVTLRRINIFLIYFLSFLNSYLLITKTHFSKKHLVFKFIITLGLSLSCLFCLQFWIVFPNYNLLNFQGLLLMSLGFLVVRFYKNLNFFYIAILFSFGLLLIFLAKPTSFLAVSILLFLSLLMQKVSVKSLGIGFLTFIFVLSAAILAMDSHFLKFYERLVQGLEFMSVLESGHSFRGLFRWDMVFSSDSEKSNFFLFGVSLVGSFFVNFLNINKFFKFLIPVSLASFFFIVSERKDIDGKLLLWLPLLTLFYLFWIYLTQRSSLKNDHSKWVSILSVGLLPICYSFGTGNNFWFICSFVGFFWVLAFSDALLSLKENRNLTQCFYVLVGLQAAASMFLVFKSVNAPYRQAESFFKSRTSITIDPLQSPLVVSQPLSEYMTQLISLRDKYQTQGHLLLDLTGHSPGVSWLLKMEAPGVPWIFGGYPGSIEFTKKVLSILSCDQIASSWLFIEPQGPLKIPFEVLREYKISEDHYITVAQLQSPVGDFPVSYSQLLLKPRNEDHLRELCRSARAVAGAPFTNQ